MDAEVAQCYAEEVLELKGDKTLIHLFSRKKFVKKLMENELCTAVIAESMKLHTYLGPGLLESVYEECLYYSLVESGLNVEKQKPIPLVYKERQLPCGFRCDLLIEGRLIIEVKAVEAFNDIHLAQVLTYLRLSDVKLGLLINFNVSSLRNGLKRVVNNLR